MQEPPYNMAEVQRADRELVGSVATRLEGRPAWLPHLAEMLLLCNEASKRYAGLESAWIGFHSHSTALDFKF